MITNNKVVKMNGCQIPSPTCKLIYSTINTSSKRDF